MAHDPRPLCTGYLAHTPLLKAEKTKNKQKTSASFFRRRKKQEHEEAGTEKQGTEQSL
jgi:hypothetical protein